MDINVLSILGIALILSIVAAVAWFVSKGSSEDSPSDDAPITPNPGKAWKDGDKDQPAPDKYQK